MLACLLAKTATQPGGQYDQRYPHSLSPLSVQNGRRLQPTPVNDNSTGCQPVRNRLR